MNNCILISHDLVGVTRPVQVLRRLKDTDVKRQLYHAHHMLWSDSGAANNYAQGRCMANAAGGGNRSLVEMIEDNAQALARSFAGAGGWSSSVLFHSLAGGSGSGVSGALLNALGDITRARSMCICVAPLDAGETCTQAFNTVRAQYPVLSLAPSIYPAMQVLCAKDMLQHCDVVLLLDNDSLLKQAAAKQLKSAASPPGAAGGAVAGGVGMTLSDANKVPIGFCNSKELHVTSARLQRRPSSTFSATPWPCRLRRSADQHATFISIATAFAIIVVAALVQHAVFRSTCSACKVWRTLCAAATTPSSLRTTRRVLIFHGVTSISAW